MENTLQEWYLYHACPRVSVPPCRNEWVNFLIGFPSFGWKIMFRMKITLLDRLPSPGMLYGASVGPLYILYINYPRSIEGGVLVIWLNLWLNPTDKSKSRIFNKIFITQVISLARGCYEISCLEWKSHSWTDYHLQECSIERA